MSKSNRQYLEDMLQYTQVIADLALSGREELEKNFVLQLATTRAYEIIGEIAKRLPSDLLALQPEAEWDDVKGFRDYLAHNYDKIEVEYIWRAIQKLPILQKAIQSLLNSLENKQ
ncbi:MAG: DUF86 domain-containing protein [Anaerolineae bacterium]|nr:DUF86 domain-containing protein [Anaerolineae bacterium]